MKTRTVDKEEFDAFLKGYPRPLDRDVVRFCEPPQIQYNDFSLGDWPKSVVASTNEVWGRDYRPTGEHQYRIAQESSQ